MAQLLALERIVALMGRDDDARRAKFINFIRDVRAGANFEAGGVDITCRPGGDCELEFHYNVGRGDVEDTWCITNLRNDAYLIDCSGDMTNEAIVCQTPAHAIAAIKNFFEFEVAQLIKRGPLFWETWLQAFRSEFEIEAGKGPWHISGAHDPLRAVVIKHAGTDYAFHVYPAWKVDSSGRKYKYKVVYQYDIADKKPFGYADNADQVIRWIEERFVPLRAAHRGPFPGGAD